MKANQVNAYDMMSLARYDRVGARKYDVSRITSGAVYGALEIDVNDSLYDLDCKVEKQSDIKDNLDLRVLDSELLYDIFRVIGSVLSIWMFFLASYGQKIMLIPAIIMFVLVLSSSLVRREKKWRRF